MINILIFLLLAISTTALAEDVKPIIKKLDNGLTVIVQSMPSAQSAAIYMLIKTGSVNETNCLGCGMSHYVEHMLFKGTSRRKVGDIPKEVKALGGVINAQTGFDDTLYTLDLPADKWREGMDLIADMMMNPVFDANEAQKERTVIHGEMRLYEDRPMRKLSDLIFKNAYLSHPYKHTVIGYKDLFDKVTRDQLYTYYKEHYTPNNMVLSVAGNINPDEVIKLATTLYGQFESKPYQKRLVDNEDAVIAPRVNIEEYPTKVYYYSYAFQTIGLLNKDLYALDLVSMALGQGESSILYEKLFEQKRLVESVSASNWTPLDKGLFEIEMTLSSNKLDDALKIINQTLEQIKKNGIDEKQLARVKKKAIVDFAFNNQRPNQIAVKNAQDYAFTGDTNFSKNYVTGITAVTNADIKRVTDTYLNPSHSILTGIVPQIKKAAADSKLPSQSAEPQVIKLANGLTVILKYDPNVEVMHTSLYMHGGVRFESATNNGITQFFIYAWPRITKKWPDQQFSAYTESQGIEVSPFAAKDAIGINIDSIGSDAIKSLDILYELLTQLKLNQPAIDKTRTTLLTSLKQREDDITTMVFIELFKRFYKDHPYALDSLGTKENIESFTMTDIQQLIKDKITPKNAVLTIAGKFDEKDITQFINTHFAKWQAYQENNTPIPEAKEYQPSAANEYVLELPKEQIMLGWALPAPSMHDHDRFEMQCIDRLLGGGLGGRLFTKVRDELGQAYTLGSTFVPGLKTGVFIIYVLTNKDKANDVKAIVNREITDLVNKPITAKELEDIKNYMIGRQQMGLDTPAAISQTLANDEFFGLGIDTYLKYPQEVKTITVDSVARVAKKYLDLGKATTVITRTKNSIEQNQ